ELRRMLDLARASQASLTLRLPSYPSRHNGTCRVPGIASFPDRKPTGGLRCSRVALQPSPSRSSRSPAAAIAAPLPTRHPNRNLPAQGEPTGQAVAERKVVMGNDLKIMGQGLKIISQGTLQVDGEIEGDVGGAEVIIGERGKVTGTVAAERVIVRGTISGVIRGATVTLQSSSHVEGGIHHMSLAIEHGAELGGRCPRRR